MHKINKQDQKQ